jgi:MFS transporter, NNP family, nitrate/nitrite transporter
MPPSLLQTPLDKRAARIRLLDFTSAPMRAFHMSWLAFFLCFFGWFGVAPLMAIIRDELHLSKAQVGNTIIASVAVTIFARLGVGWLCDRIGPRLAYTGLLLLGSVPVMLIGLAHDYQTFLLFRLAIGAIGASFVITQYHSTVMFAPNVVGTANAMTAGWGNLGGGATQMLMPLLFSACIGIGFSQFRSWRLAMVVPGVAMLIAGILYYKLTQDTPGGDLSQPSRQLSPRATANATRAFGRAITDYRVWVLFVLYGASFGMELTIDNVAALYFHDYFRLTLRSAGIVAGSFGLMNLFARALGGFASDRMAQRFGFSGRTALLSCTLLFEGLGLAVFSRMHLLPAAIAAMLTAGLFLKMSNGAIYAVVPFIRKDGLGAVAGIVGAGGNAAAVMAGFLFKMERVSWPDAMFILGIVVAAISVLALTVKPSEQPAQNSSLLHTSAVNMESDVLCRVASS